MLRLWRQCLFPVLVSWVCSLALAFALLLFTVVPWLRTPATSRAVLLPMLLMIFGRAAELATILGVPAALAMGIRRWMLRLPSDWAKSRSSIATVCALGALVFTVVLASVNTWSLAPGRVARAALTMARERCLQGPSKIVPISVLNAAWVCRAYASPRLEGTVSGGAQRISFSAGSVRISDDLLSVDLDDFRLDSAGPSPKLQLHSPHATVHGARAALRPANLGPWLRAILAATTGFVLGAVAAYRVSKSGWSGWRSVFLSWGAALASALTFIGVDYGASTVLAAYCGVPVAGLVALFVIERLLQLLDRGRRKSATV